MMELINELDNQRKCLVTSLKQLKVNGTAYAEAERDYKVTLRQEILKLRDEGMAVGLINLTAYGIPSVAEKRFKRDVAEAVYKANQEAINTYKLQIRIIESQINREWENAEHIAG